MRLRPTVRLRLTALYAVLFVVAGGLLLAVSYMLLDRHLSRTLPDTVSADVLAEVRGQYALALIAVGALALLLGWIAAGRALSPLRGIVSAARAVSGESLDRRIDLHGPDDELRELAETFDEMLARLEAAFQSQRRFVANASHELRTPLTVMRTEVEVALANSDATVDELRSTAEVVRDEVKRCQDLIDGLLALARSEAGTAQRGEPVDLGELAGHVVRRLQDSAAARGIVLTVEADSAPVRGERRLLEQMVWNLGANAVEHNVSGGFGRVEVGREPGGVILRVENGGTPIPPATVASLLEPFEGKGAGIGLSIVRAVAQAHGGSVQLASRAGGGLVAEVRLPSATGVRARAPAGAGARGTGARTSSRLSGHAARS